MQTIFHAAGSPTVVSVVSPSRHNGHRLDADIWTGVPLPNIDHHPSPSVSLNFFWTLETVDTLVER